MEEEEEDASRCGEGGAPGAGVPEDEGPSNRRVGVDETLIASAPQRGQVVESGGSAAPQRGQAVMEGGILTHVRAGYRRAAAPSR